MPVPRGKVVGGSSSINGMVYVRGNRANYDSWAAEGNTGWDADTVNAAYKRMEDFEDGANDYRGAGGPIRITRNKTPQEGTLQFIQATSDALGVKVLDDYNAESQEGISRMQQNAADGLRYSASRGLHPQPRRAHAGAADRGDGHQDHHRERSRRRASRSSTRTARTRIVRAGKEVILSAGFVGSAQLLMLSGIGHAEHLAEHGITTIADLPVGDNLHDHMFHALTFHVTTSTMRGNAVLLRQGRREGAAAAGQDLPGELGLRVGGLRAHLAGDRRTRPAAAPAAVVLRLAQPGRADPPRRRPAPVADGARRR